MSEKAAAAGLLLAVGGGGVCSLREVVLEVDESARTALAVAGSQARVCVRAGRDGPAAVAPAPFALRVVDDLVFAHPQKGTPLDRSKVSKRFKAACVEAKVRPVRFHDLRHTFATRLAASSTPIRTIQEFLGHADSKTTQIYAHYAPSKREVQMVDEAFAPQASDEVADQVLRRGPVMHEDG